MVVVTTILDDDHGLVVLNPDVDPVGHDADFIDLDVDLVDIDVVLCLSDVYDAPLRAEQRAPEDATHPKTQILRTFNCLHFRVCCVLGCSFLLL